MSREASSVSPKRRNRLFDNKPKLEFKPCKGVIRHKDCRDKLPNQTEIEKMLIKQKFNAKNKLISAPMSTQQIITAHHINEQSSFACEVRPLDKHTSSNVYHNISMDDMSVNCEDSEITLLKSPSKIKASLLRRISLLEKPIEILREEVRSILQDRGYKVSKGEFKTFINEAKDYHLRRLKNNEITFDQFKSIIIREKGYASFE